MLHNGLYEQIINKALEKELSATDKLSQTASIDTAEAAKVLAKYVAANYVAHDGSKPMNITWKLDQPIPAKYLKKTNKLVVG